MLVHEQKLKWRGKSRRILNAAYRKMRHAHPKEMVLVGLNIACWTMLVSACNASSQPSPMLHIYCEKVHKDRKNANKDKSPKA